MHKKREQQQLRQYRWYSSAMIGDVALSCSQRTHTRREASYLPEDLMGRSVAGARGARRSIPYLRSVDHVEVGFQALQVTHKLKRVSQIHELGTSKATLTRLGHVPERTFYTLYLSHCTQWTHRLRKARCFRRADYQGSRLCTRAPPCLLSQHCTPHICQEGSQQQRWHCRSQE